MKTTYQLKNVATSELIDSLREPVWENGFWSTGAGTVDDPTGGDWVVVATTIDPLPRHITVLAFRNRFTQAEKVAMEIASLDPGASASAPARAQAAALRVSMQDTASATFIDLDRADTRAGVQALETVGILANGRALAILDADVQDIERFQG